MKLSLIAVQKSHIEEKNVCQNVVKLVIQQHDVGGSIGVAVKVQIFKLASQDNLKQKISPPWDKPISVNTTMSTSNFISRLF